MVSSNFEMNMKFIISFILLVHMVLFRYRALEFASSPYTEITLSLSLVLRKVRGSLGRVIPPSDIYVAENVGGRDKKDNLWICLFGVFYLLAKTHEQITSPYVYTKR